MDDDAQETQLFIDALVGIGTGNLEVSMALAEQGFIRFSGNQHNWEWNIGVLGELKLNTLKELYAGLCNLRRKTESLTPTGAIQ